MITAKLVFEKNNNCSDIGEPFAELKIERMARNIAFKENDSTCPGFINRPRLGDDDEDPDKRINRDIVHHALAVADDWDRIDLYETLELWIARLAEALLGGSLPPAVLSIEYSRRNQFGYFRPQRDGLGLRWRININAMHRDRPMACQLATLCHELTHLWECNLLGWKQSKDYKYHSSVWRRKAHELGISTLDNRKGVWQSPRPDSPFVILLTKYGVDTTPLWNSDEAKGGVVAAATLATSSDEVIKYKCDCPGELLINETNGHYRLDGQCNRCGNPYIATTVSPNEYLLRVQKRLIVAKRDPQFVTNKIIKLLRAEINKVEADKNLKS